VLPTYLQILIWKIIQGMKKEVAKPLLFFCDVLLAFVAIILLGLAGYGTAKGFFSFVLGTSLFMGCALILVPIINAISACTQSNRFLIVSFVCMLFLTLLMVFLFLGAFIFSAKLSRKIEANWQNISANYDPPLTESEVFTAVQQNAYAVGGTSFVGIFLLGLALACTSTVLEYDYSLKRLLKVANYFTAIVGLAMLIIAAAFGFGQVGGAWMPQVIVAIAIIILIVSIVGYWGTHRESRLLLRIYFFSVLVLSLTLFSIGVYTLADGDSVLNFVADHWSDEFAKTVPKDVSEEQFLDFLDRNFTLLGCAAIAAFIFMVFNEVIAFLLLRQLGGLIQTTMRKSGGDNVMDLRKSAEGLN